MTPGAPRLIRFGLFELDLAAGELRKGGRLIKLQEQPFQVLAALLQRSSAVNRDELQRVLGPADSFVAFDEGLNTAIKRSVGRGGIPRKISDLLKPRRGGGYRFIAPVSCAESAMAPIGPAPIATAAETEAAGTIAANRQTAHNRRWRWAIPALGMVASTLAWLMWVNPKSEPAPVPIPLTAYRGDEVSPSFSPDGNQVAFA